MTWQQQQEQHYLDRLRERWNEDGTRKDDTERILFGSRRIAALMTRQLQQHAMSAQATDAAGNAAWTIDLCNQ